MFYINEYKNGREHGLAEGLAQVADMVRSTCCACLDDMEGADAEDFLKSEYAFSVLMTLLEHIAEKYDLEILDPINGVKKIEKDNERR